MFRDLYANHEVHVLDDRDRLMIAEVDGLDELTALLDVEALGPLDSVGTLETEDSGTSLLEHLEHLTRTATDIDDRLRLQHRMEMTGYRTLGLTVSDRTVLGPEFFPVRGKEGVVGHLVGLTRSHGYSLTGLRIVIDPSRPRYADLYDPMGIHGSSFSSHGKRRLQVSASSSYIPKTKR